MKGSTGGQTSILGWKAAGVVKKVPKHYWKRLRARQRLLRALNQAAAVNQPVDLRPRLRPKDSA